MSMADESELGQAYMSDGDIGCRDVQFDCDDAVAGEGDTTEPTDDSYAQSGSSDQRQVGGSHYVDMAVQPWAALEDWMTAEQFAGYLRGSAISYLARAGQKGRARDDVMKALHYLCKLTEVMAEKDQG